MDAIAPNRFLPFASMILISNRMAWQSGWLQTEEPVMQGNVSSFLRQANLKIQSADTKEKVLDLIKTYEEALAVDSKNREAIMGAAWYCCLIALAYASTNEEKRDFFIKAVIYCEQAMYLNPEFAGLVNKGEKVWEACRVLSKTELDALFLYYIALSSCWKDSLKGFERLLNLKWVFRAKKALNHMMAIDPEWGGGSPYYAWANYYAAAPKFAGGDPEKAAAYYEKAIELGPEMPNFRRTRALLLHAKNKDREALKQDLNWVLAQDPKKQRHYFTYPYCVFVQNEAREVLANIDHYL